MADIDRATNAQNWLMEYYRNWIPLDACLALVRSIDPDRERLGADRKRLEAAEKAGSNVLLFYDDDNPIASQDFYDAIEDLRAALAGKDDSQ